MNIFKIVFGMATIGFLAACQPVSGPDSEAPTATFKSEQAKAFVAGFQPSEVTVRRKAQSASISAACRIESSKFSLDFQAPATVNLPAYSQGAVPARLTCTVDEQSFQQDIAPVNLSKRARTNSAVGVALLCPICGLGVAAGNSGEKSTDIFGFADIELKIE